MSYATETATQRIVNALERIADRLEGIEYGLTSPEMGNALKAVVEISEALKEEEE